MIMNVVYQRVTGLRKTCRELIPLNREKLNLRGTTVPSC